MTHHGVDLSFSWDLVLSELVLEHKVLPSEEFRHLGRRRLGHRSEIGSVVERLVAGEAVRAGQ